MNNIPIDQAVQEVDWQAQAYKNDPSLGAKIAAHRGIGNMDKIKDLTSFDIYRAGEESMRIANEDKINNPGSAYDTSWKNETGN